MKFYQVDESVSHGASVTGAGECSDGDLPHTGERKGSERSGKNNQSLRIIL